MNIFNPVAFQTLPLTGTDVYLGTIPEGSLYSVRLMDKVCGEFNRYYIRTRGLGFSIEIKGTLDTGKFLVSNIRDMLKDALYIESSVRSTFAPSTELLKHLNYEYDLIEIDECLYLSVNYHDSTVIIKDIKPGQDVTMLEDILYFDEHGWRKPTAYTSLSEDDRVKLIFQLRDDLTIEEWPEGKESLRVNFGNQEVEITYHDHLDILESSVY